MIKKTFDTMIIGSGLGGLISGALLAKKGMDVLVVNQDELPWSFSCGGFSIPRESFAGQGLKRYLFELIFEELDLKTHERRLFERSRPLFQVVSPHYRLDVCGEREELFEQYRRDFPQHIDAIRLFYKTLDDFSATGKGDLSQHDLKTPLHGHRFAKLLSPEGASAPLEKIFEKFHLPLEFRQNILVQISFLTHLYAEKPSLALAARVLGLANQKDFYFAAESKDLAKIFYDRILSCGGSVRQEAKVERLYVQQKTISEARLNTYEGMIKAGSYIGNLELHRLFELFDLRQVPGRLQRKLRHAQPQVAQCSFYVGVKANVLPVGMQQDVVLLADVQKPLLEENLVFIHVLRQEAEPAKALLQVSFFRPYPEAMAHQPEYKHFEKSTYETMTKILDKLRWLIPFLDQNLVMLIPDFNNSGLFPPELRNQARHLPMVRGYYAADKSDASAVVNAFNKTIYPNLFFTGREIFPGLGFEGETISSLNAANLAYQNWQLSRGYTK